MTRPLASFVADTRAVAAVEMVLILPLAILLTLTAMEAGAYLYAEHQVVKGVRDAARYAARLPFSTYGCLKESSEADLPTTNTAWQSIANVAAYGTVDQSGERRLWTWSADTTGIAVRLACKDLGTNSGIYATQKFAPQVAVIGKPTYPSLFKTLAGFPATYRLYARQQALGAGI